jgi:sulfite reductase alpha subunit-like flavoprotein
MAKGVREAWLKIIENFGHMTSTEALAVLDTWTNQEKRYLLDVWSS